MSPLSWITAGLAGASALGAGTFLRYRLWMGARRRALAAGSRVAETSAGPIEHALEDGDGPVLLVSHGTPGGYDQGIAFCELVRPAGFRTLALSRPGYLRTPASVGLDLERQADAFAALLDALGLSDAVALGISGGAPAALTFARRHRRRCRGLVLVSGVSRPLESSNTPLLDWLLTRDAGAWLLTRSIGLTVRTLEPVRTHRSAIHRLRRTTPAVQAFAVSAAPAAPRLAGWRNDERLLAALDPELATGIESPTVVFHGTRDSVVPFDHAEWVASAIRSAQLIAVEGAGHLAFAARRDLLVSALVELRGACPPEASRVLTP